MNSKPFLNAGSNYTYVAELDSGRKTYAGKYLGFQVEGGVTIFAFEYTTKKGDVKPLYLQAHQFICAEPSETTTYDKNTVKTESSLSDAVDSRRGRTLHEEVAHTATDTSSVDAASTPTTDTSAPKRRGRPPKDPNAVKTPKPATPATTSPVDANGNVVPRKRGRPPKTRPEDQQNAATVPPNIPTPASVEEVDEIEESTDTDTVVVAATTSEKTVRAAVAPNTDNTDEGPGIIALNSDDDDDDEEVVPARTRLAPASTSVPKRPVSNLARSSHVPDEVDGDL